MINRRYSEINEKERAVANEIKSMAIKVISEINKRGKKLLTDLNAVCGAKKNQLGQKQTEIVTLSKKLDHAMKFAEFILESGNVTAMMHSKKLLVNQLRNVLRTRCEVPNPYHVVDIRVRYDERNILSALSKHGVLIVDNIPCAIPDNVNRGQSPQSSNQKPQLTAAQQASLAQQLKQRLPHMNNLAPEQKVQLMKRIAQVQQMRNSPASSPTSLLNAPKFPTTSDMKNNGTLHYPPSAAVAAGQSNTVTSSHNAAKYYQTGTGGGSVSSNPRSMINLEQLQRRRAMQMQQQSYAAGNSSASSTSSISPSATSMSPGGNMGGNNYQNAIVIQPASSPDTPQPSSTVHHGPGILETLI